MKHESIQRGKFLQELRKANNMTQEELAEHMGVDSSDITLMETGIKYPEDEETLEKLAFYLNVTKNELINGNFDKNEVAKAEYNQEKIVLTTEHKKNLLLIVLSCIVIFIIIISVASLYGDGQKDTYYLYFNSDNIVDNESTLTKKSKYYSLAFNTLETNNKKGIKSVTIYYMDSNNQRVIVSGDNKDYDLVENKKSTYNLKELANEKAYLEVIYDDDTKETSKITISKDYKYIVTDEREPIKHTVKTTNEYIIHNTQALSGNDPSRYDGSVLLNYGFTKVGDIYVKKSKNYYIEYKDAILYLTIYRAGGNKHISRDIRLSSIKITDTSADRTVVVETAPPQGKLNCDIDLCTLTSDYSKYLNMLVSEIRG